MATLFISDLHLHPARPAINDCLLRFLREIQGNAEALYILGDLFEAWVGDDHPEPAYRPVKQALRASVQAGTPVFLLHGNRDFLIGGRFCEETGCTLLDDPSTIDLYGRKTVLMHGDSLCTDDLDYQRLRKQIRDPQWQQQALSLPLQERLQLAGEARDLSSLSLQDKDEHIMDVNQNEVRRALDEHQAELLIHGHTHRPGIHSIVHKGRALKRIVLGDWYQYGSVLYAGPENFELRKLEVY